MYSFTVLEARGPKSRCQQSWLLLEGCEGASVLCLSPSCWQCPPIFSVSWLVAPWLCDHLLPVCPCVFSRLFPVCVCVCVSKLPLGYWITATATAKSCQSCPTLCNPIDGSPPGSPVPGILQARILDWVAISFSNAWKWKMKVKSLSRVQLLATPWTAAYQAPPSMGFSRQEYWSGVPLPSPGCWIGTTLMTSTYLDHICKDLYHK